MVLPEYQLRLNQDPHWHMKRPHFHDSCEILLPLSNAGSLFIENRLYPMQRGTLFLISRAALHRTVVDGPYERFVLYVHPRTLEELSTSKSNFVTQMQNVNHCVILDEAQLEEMVQLMSNLHTQRMGGEFGDDLRCTVALLNVLLKVISLLEIQNPGQSISNRSFSRVAPILEYIRENLSQPMSLDLLAEKFYINKHHLCHLFKAATGFSVMEYIIANRVLRARELLREGHSVQSAGEQAGFSSNSHFIRTFKEITGTSPGRFAKEHRDSDKIVT